MNDTRTREISWTIDGDEIRVIAILDGTKYGIFVTSHDRQQVLRDLGLCAADPATNMTWQDAVEIAAKLREIRPVVVPSVQFSIADIIGMLICTLLSGSLWGVAIAALWWSIRWLY